MVALRGLTNQNGCFLLPVSLQFLHLLFVPLPLQFLLFTQMFLPHPLKLLLHTVLLPSLRFDVLPISGTGGYRHKL